MIQDIEPLELNNQYIQCKPQDDDRVFYFDGERLLINRDEMDRLELPLVADFREAGYRENYRYLFDISGIRYFLFTGEILGTLRGFKYESYRALRQITSKDICFAAATAYHLFVWYRDNKFCGRCASPLIHSDTERMLKCPLCGNEVYPKIAPAVIVGVCDGDKILLTKYAGRVYKRYALIAGFTEIGETPEQTVHREVMEEVGLEVCNIRYYKSQPWGADSNLLLGYFADLDGSSNVSLDTDELATAQWFDRWNIPIEDDHISLTRDMVETFKAGRE